MRFFTGGIVCFNRKVDRYTAEQVNEWSLRGFGHDSINASIVIRARCEREGVPDECSRCHGHGSIETYPGQRAEAEAWLAEVRNHSQELTTGVADQRLADYLRWWIDDEAPKGKPGRAPLAATTLTG